MEAASNGVRFMDTFKDGCRQMDRKVKMCATFILTLTLHRLNEAKLPSPRY